MFSKPKAYSRNLTKGWKSEWCQQDYMLLLWMKVPCHKWKTLPQTLLRAVITPVMFSTLTSSNNIQAQSVSQISTDAAWGRWADPAVCWIRPVNERHLSFSPSLEHKIFPSYLAPLLVACWTPSWTDAAFQVKRTPLSICLFLYGVIRLLLNGLNELIEEVGQAAQPILRSRQRQFHSWKREVFVFWVQRDVRSSLSSHLFTPNDRYISNLVTCCFNSAGRIFPLTGNFPLIDRLLLQKQCF